MFSFLQVFDDILQDHRVHEIGGSVRLALWVIFSLIFTLLLGLLVLFLPLVFINLLEVLVNFTRRRSYRQNVEVHGFGSLGFAYNILN